MGSSTTKKVQVQRWDRDPLTGFVNSQTYLGDAGIEFLTQSGSASVVPYGEIKAVHFVREFEAGRVDLEKKSFLARPKYAGLWVRLHFRDDDLWEAIVPNDLLQVEARGFTVVPPDANGNTQKLFVPRSALRDVQVLSVIGSPLRRPVKKQPAAAKEQIALFEDEAAG